MAATGFLFTYADMNSDGSNVAIADPGAGFHIEIYSMIHSHDDAAAPALFTYREDATGIASIHIPAGGVVHFMSPDRTIPILKLSSNTEFRIYNPAGVDSDASIVYRIVED